MQNKRSLNTANGRGRHYALMFMLWVVVFFAYSYISLSVPNRTSFLAPDENNTYVVAKSIREEGTIYIDSPLNERFGVDFFRGRLYTETEKNRYTAFNSLGLSILVALGMYTNTTFFIVPFLASLGVWGIFLITRRLASDRAGFIAAFLFALISSNIFFSNLLLDATPAFSLFLLSLGLTLAAIHSGRLIGLVIAGLSLGLAFFIRQVTAVYIFLFLIFLFLNFRKLGVKGLAAILVPAFLVAFPTVLMNRFVYGSFIHTGQLAGTGVSTGKALLPGISFSGIVHSIYLYVLQYLPFVSIPALMGIYVALRRRKRGEAKYIHLLAFAIVLITILMYASRSGTWSFQVFSMSGSMARYFIPVYAFMAVYAGMFLEAVLSNGRTTVVSLILIAQLCSCCAISFGHTEYASVPYLKKRFSTITLSKEQLLQSGEPTVIFTKRLDKDVYDDVEVALCFTQEDIEETPDLGFLPIVDPETDVLPVIDELLDEGWRVLISADAAEVIDALLVQGYTVERIKELGLSQVAMEAE